VLRLDGTTADLAVLLRALGAVVRRRGWAGLAGYNSINGERVGRSLRQHLACQAHRCDRHAGFGRRQPMHWKCGKCLHHWLLKKQHEQFETACDVAELIFSKYTEGNQSESAQELPIFGFPIVTWGAKNSSPTRSFEISSRGTGPCWKARAR
jgi:hypothetical protein